MSENRLIIAACVAFALFCVYLGVWTLRASVLEPRCLRAVGLKGCFEDSGLNVRCSPLHCADEDQSSSKRRYDEIGEGIHAVEKGIPRGIRKVAAFVAGGALWLFSLPIGGWLLYRDHDALRGCCVLLIGCCAFAGGILLGWLL